MDNLLTITLEANHDQRNHHRSYRITIGRDLFGAWTVNICYSRVGQRGHELNFGHADAEPMQKVVQDHLRRRLSAPGRIGCSYVLHAFDSAAAFDGSDWIPTQLVAAFAPRP